MNFGKIFILTMVMVFLTKPFVPIFFYVANVDYIKEYFCINKDKPMLHCGGTCFLAKKIAEAKKKEQSDRQVVDTTMLQVDWIYSFQLQFNGPIVAQLTETDYISTPYHNIYLANPFRPPKTA
ncbi:hypothetical protein [Sphingobacterium faecium]|uniref:hypothetical protein n=1 Tax=Sphingobacterium faecium TaxID=34087 RepID=UPI002469149C|nr:hypothetical protein [Sphingobacterium faecium]MDH5826645.1 hypothetical protein [Sphingobacterium faecium]